MKHKAIFLDKDGTLVENVPYNCSPKVMRLMPNVGEGLRTLQDAGYKLIVISNQSAVARGYFAEQDLKPLFKALRNYLSQYGVELDGIYYCPHHPEGAVIKYAKECLCRKPQPGLIQKAANIHNIDLSASWMIGDILHDIEAGNKAGCRTIMVDNGYETEWDLRGDRTPGFQVNSFKDVIDIILPSKQKHYEEKNVEENKFQFISQ